ncbi:hypothetical protein VTP01DRAFT_4012 [Rhizomucor pusillus]|uniref:uncharacterized protein n=1 Tax=Rhizomucor pusillus TaxID=4840 RepID=UPI003743C9BB
MSSTKGSDAETAEDREDDFQTPIVPRKRALKKPERQTAGTSDYRTIKRSKNKDAIAGKSSSKRRKTTETPTKRKKRVMTVKSSIKRFVGSAISKSAGEARHHLKSSRTDGTTRYRGLIDRHIKNYLKHFGFSRKALTNSQQIARYEGSSICTAYLNSIKNCFGNRLRYVINSLLKVKDYRARITKEMTEQGNTRGLLSSEKQSQLLLEFHDASFSAYPVAYEFDEDSVYYDSKSRPGNHALAYVMMAKFCEDHEIKTFQCMPLRTSWIPAHMQIDTRILATQMLKKPNNIDFDSDLWKQVVNFQ